MTYPVDTCLVIIHLELPIEYHFASLGIVSKPPGFWQPHSYFLPADCNVIHFAKKLDGLDVVSESCRA